MNITADSFDEDATDDVSAVADDTPETATDIETAKQANISIFDAIASLILCLGLSALLASGKLLEVAERQPLGDWSTRLVQIAETNDRVANFLSLNRPYDALTGLRGVGNDAGERVNTVDEVVGMWQFEANTPSSDSSNSDGTDAVTEATTSAADCTKSIRTECSADVVSDSDNNSADLSLPEGADLPDTDTVASDEFDTDSSTSMGSGHDVDDAATPGSGSGMDSSTSAGSSYDVDEHMSGKTPQETTQPAIDEQSAESSEISKPLPVVAPGTQLNVYVAGDSQSYYLSFNLKRSAISSLLNIEQDSRHSTGLSRPDYFNWPAHLVEVLSASYPDLVVLFMGSNDWQNIRDDKEILTRGSSEWAAEWSSRLTFTLDVLAAPYRHVVWVGLPPTRPSSTHEGFAFMNQLARDVISKREGVTMLDIWEMFGGDSPYQASVALPDDPDAGVVKVRQADGIHLNITGARWVTDRIIEVINSQWDLPE